MPQSWYAFRFTRSYHHIIYARTKYVCPQFEDYLSVRLLEVLNIDLVVISRLFIEYYCIGIRAVSSQFKCKSYIKVFALIKIYFKIWFNDSPPRTNWPISASCDSRAVSFRLRPLARNFKLKTKNFEGWWHARQKRWFFFAGNFFLKISINVIFISHDSWENFIVQFGELKNKL